MTTITSSEWATTPKVSILDEMKLLFTRQVKAEIFFSLHPLLQYSVFTTIYTFN